MSKNKFNKNWLMDHINDPYVKLAKKEGYRARAAYKLKEIDEQDKLIKPGQSILDLGSAPGSWSQYAQRSLSMKSRFTKNKYSRIIAVDSVPMEPIAEVAFILGDFREESVLNNITTELQKTDQLAKLDLILSDMAPNLSGVAAADSAHMSYLAELTLEFARLYLKEDGALLMKYFYGSGYSQIVEDCKGIFKKVVARKPKASRDKSSEVFLLLVGLKDTKKHNQ